MSVKGLLESEKKANTLQRQMNSSFNKQLRELKQELRKVEYLLGDKKAASMWANSPADSSRLQQLRSMLNEAERLYLEAGNSRAARIFKQRMEKQLRQRLTNLKANELEVMMRSQAHRATTEKQMLDRLTSIKREGAARELYMQSRSAGGFISGAGRGFMQDLVTLETKAAGSKTIGEYMNNLYTQYEKGLKDVFVKGIIRGDSYKQMENNLMRATDITKGKARILVRTEANAIFNESVREVIDNNPLVKGYRFRAVLDRRTSKTCQHMDGKYIPKEDVKPGVNFPPLHPNCRSTVTTVLASENERKDAVQRYTKNRSNEWVPVPPGMTYPEFKRRMQEFDGTNVNVLDTSTSLTIDTPEARVLYNEIVKGNLYDVETLKGTQVVKQLENRIKEANRKYGNTIEIDTPERVQLREKIKNDFLAIGSAKRGKEGIYRFEGSIKKEHKLQLVIGLPASGKSTLVVNPNSESLGAFVFDSDIVKESIPEFIKSKGAAANAVHEESKYILETAKEVFLTGDRNGDNLIIPVVGSNEVSLREKWIIPFEDAGYDVEIKYRPADSVESVNRAIARNIKNGRGIPLDILFGYEDKPEKVFEAFKERVNRKGNKYVR